MPHGLLKFGAIIFSFRFVIKNSVDMLILHDTSLSAVIVFQKSVCVSVLFYLIFLFELFQKILLLKSFVRQNK